MNFVCIYGCFVFSMQKRAEQLRAHESFDFNAQLQMDKDPEDSEACTIAQVILVEDGAQECDSNEASDQEESAEPEVFVQYSQIWHVRQCDIDSELDSLNS